ncbi:MAG TPA: LysM peptidoglycan-binding domain-containing M23 family metallopeptidase [Stellaceae bacterium]|nr:LysM peptidoglycan-binding domain-containing M23 family metallopeptidase [Stellaceae bacterium]
MHVIVRRGQTLDGYAYTYHVPRSAIIAANNLRPPYELKAGQRLTIPGAGARQAEPVSHPVATASAVATPQPLAPPPAAIAQPPAHPETVAPVAQPSASVAKTEPDVIPLDGPLPKETAAAPPPREAAAAPATLTPPKPEPLAPAAVPPPVQTAAPPAAETGGRFPWPVRGRVLANYGNMPGGGHNDGINIAAPRGTPVRSIDAGTVAYAGNEVKGYGNIVLIRHANGWISAYAHLEDVTVKQGETISAGEVIAKVGNSGGVQQPQLHFELRRGKRPVDPKEFLAPAPSAEGWPTNKAG